MTDREVPRVSVYLNGEVKEELLTEAARLGRSVSWLLRYAWRLSLAEIRKMPAPPVVGGKDDE